MSMNLDRLAGCVETADRRAICAIDYFNNQIYVSFINRTGETIPLLLPPMQKDIAEGHMDERDFTNVLLGVRRFANEGETKRGFRARHGFTRRRCIH